MLSIALIFKQDSIQSNVILFVLSSFSSKSTTNIQNDNKVTYEKKKYEDEIVRLRGENEFLKALLIKHGINYSKERNSFKSDETL